MKKRTNILLLLFIVFSNMPIYADSDCDVAISEAKSKYNSGKYNEAKELFEWVKKECGSTYTATANSWIQKCDQAMNGGSKPSSTSSPQQSSSSATASPSSSSSSSSTATLSLSRTYITASASGTTEYITVSSNRNWEIHYPSASMYTVTKINNTSIKVVINKNTGASRQDFFNIKTTDGSQTVRVNLSQSQGSSSSSNSSNSSSATLSLSKTYITASAAGTTEYITITSNRNWEIEYPSASMYTVTKQSNTSVKVVINRNTGGSRQDFFNIKTTDGSQTVKVNLSQSQGSSSSSSSSSNSSNYSSSSYRPHSNYSLPPISRFNSSHGSFEVFWIGVNGMIGTAVGAEISTLGLRWSWFELDAIVAGVKYDFLSQKPNIYYQPDVRFYIPWDDDFAVTFAVGPSISSLRNWWFTTEVGVHWHWGNAGSSNFFARYDGDFMVGVSINASSSY